MKKDFQIVKSWLTGAVSVLPFVLILTKDPLKLFFIEVWTHSIAMIAILLLVKKYKKYD